MKLGKKIILFILLFSPVFLWSQYPNVQAGEWKGDLKRSDSITIPFTFEIFLKSGYPELYIINASEKLLVNDIQLLGDSVIVNMPFFDAKFVVAQSSYNEVRGSYYKTSGERIIRYDFTGKYNQPRFLRKIAPKYNISGKWDINFNDKETGDVGIFEQNGDGKVTGTILTPTGDYRFMEGILDGDSLKMSVFDGGYTMLLTAKVENNNKLSNGYIYSGFTGMQKWSAIKNNNLKIADEELTKMRPGENKLHFSFVSTNGDTVSIDDEKYKGKVVLIQILGSWCPNCMDETAFLSEYYNKNRDRGLEVIGIAYERTNDYNKNKRLLQPYIERFNVKYPILLPPVTVSDPDKEQKTLPQIEKIRAYPSLIYIGKDGKVRKIHSGFNGPATGEYYEIYKKEFHNYVDKLLSE